MGYLFSILIYQKFIQYINYKILPSTISANTSGFVKIQNAKADDAIQILQATVFDLKSLYLYLKEVENNLSSRLL